MRAQPCPALDTVAHTLVSGVAGLAAAAPQPTWPRRAAQERIHTPQGLMAALTCKHGGVVQQHSAAEEAALQQ